MITFKSLTIKNFMSIGAITQSIDLSKEPLLLIIGNNLDAGTDN